MSAERRLIEECDDPIELGLLCAGRNVRASDRARERTLLALGLSAPVGGGLFAFISHVKPRMMMGMIAASALAAALPIVYFTMTANRAKSVQDVPKTQFVVESQRAVVAVDESNSRASKAPEALVVLPKPTDGVQSEPKKRVVSAAIDPNQLSLELAALDEARGLLNAGNASGALQRLDRYQREFPRPRLALEAEVLRIFAYDKAGQKATAKQRAAEFVARHPKGVLTARVRRYLEQ